MWYQSIAPTTRATIPTAAVSLAAFLGCLYLTHLEHQRSLRPSTTLCLFLGLTSLLDIARLRTLSFLPDNERVVSIFALSWVVKVVMLILESTEKRSLLKKGFEKSPIEETSGVFNRTLFWWLNPLLWKGSQITLTVDDLPALDEDLRAASNPQILLEKWGKGKKSPGYSFLIC